MGLMDDARAGILRWISDSEDDVTPEDMSVALAKSGYRSAALPTQEMPRSMFHDPYSVLDWGGWRERPSSLTYEALRQMSIQATPIAAILTLRTNQISQFCRPQQSDYDKGYRVILRDRRGNRAMSKAELKMASEIERMLETTGYLLPGERPTSRDSFRTFAKKSVRDILTFDQWCYEKQRDRFGKVSRFVALDGASIRPAVADVEHMSPEQHLERVTSVQIFENTVVAEYTSEDIAWNVMNPRTDLRVNGFGFSPIEQIVQLVTAWLFGFQYNQKFFTQGSAIKGLINLKGAIPDKQMRAFRRMWYSMVSGVGNAWRTPILNAEDVQWMSMHSSNREMEFSAWMDWLTKLICAVYGTDPTEINFQFGNTGQSSAMGDQGQEEKVVESKDRGLRPLVDHMTDSINSHIVWDLCPDFEFSFVGLDAQAESSERQARIDESSAYKTIDEVRAEVDLPPLPEGKGIMIRDPNWVSFNKPEGEEGGDAEGMPGSDAEQDIFGDDADDDLLVMDGQPEDDGGDDDDDLLAVKAWKANQNRLQKAILLLPKNED